MMDLLFLSFLISSAIVVSGEFTSEDCKEIGFIKSQLMCSSCENLKDFGLEEIKESCYECCQKELGGGSVSRKYQKAILEVCTCKFGSFPQIQAFVKSDIPSKFKNLEIKYLRGLDPQIKLLDKNGVVKETLSISKWNTDTIFEFFKEVLISDDEYARTNII